MPPLHFDAPLLDIRQASVMTEGGKRLLDDITLSIRRGEHTAILGPNGSGKSSLIKLIAHQYYPYTGDARPGLVRVLGRDRWLISELRSLIGIVSADAHRLFPTEWKTVRAFEAVLSSLLASYEVFEHHEVTDSMRERAREALALMEVDHLERRPITEMSTGELRRVLIARALAPDPEALLLDEPTTGLDLVARERFLQTLRRVARGGKTIVLVTHRVEEILPEIRRVVLLRGGRVHGDGRKDEMLTGEQLSASFGAPVEVEPGPHGYYAARMATALASVNPGDAPGARASPR